MEEGMDFTQPEVRSGNTFSGLVATDASEEQGRSEKDASNGAQRCLQAASNG